MYACGNCNHSFKSKLGLKYHTDKKVCFKDMCLQCGRNFESKRNLKYHLDHNVCGKGSEKSKIKIVLKTQQAAYEHMSKEELLQIVYEQKGEIKALKENPTTIQNIQNVQNIYYPIDHHLSNSDILRDLIKSKMGHLIDSALIDHTVTCIEHIIRETHGKPDVFPELSNVCIPNIKLPYAMIYDQGQVTRVHIDEIFPKIIEIFLSLVNKYKDEDENIERIKPETHKLIEKIINDLEDRKDPQTKKVEHCMRAVFSNVSNKLPPNHVFRQSKKSIKLVV